GFRWRRRQIVRVAPDVEQRAPLALAIVLVLALARCALARSGFLAPPLLLRIDAPRAAEPGDRIDEVEVLHALDQADDVAAIAAHGADPAVRRRLKPRRIGRVRIG